MAAVGWLQDFAHDWRYATRTLRRSPAFSLAAIITLALGIGATTAIFSVVNGVILKPLPFHDPGRLVALDGSPAIRGNIPDSFFDVYRAQATSFDALAGYGMSARFLRGRGEPDREMTVAADRNLFSILGVAPLLGRTFVPDDDGSVAVVSRSFWREHLGGDASALGAHLLLDDTDFTVVGVMPEAFQFPYESSILSGVASQRRTDIWIPRTTNPNGFNSPERVVGRLKVGVSLPTAISELNTVMSRLHDERPEQYAPRGARLDPLAETVVTASVRQPLLVLLGFVAIVLALACANVMNLLLVRTTVRTHEMAVRGALGASPVRLGRQLLAESATLAFAGGAAGAAIASWATGKIARSAALELPRAREVTVDWQMMAFALTISAITAIVFGIGPALTAMRAKTHAAFLESGARVSMSRGARRVRDGLVVAEIALAFALAVGAGLMVRELSRLRETDPGFVAANVVTFHLGERPDWYGAADAREARARSVRELYEVARRVSALPGVQGAGFTQLLPMQNWNWTANTVDVRGRPFQMELRFVTPGYFQALGIRIRRGRAFENSDDADHAPVVIVNEALARLYFGDADPIGASTPRGNVVGVVNDVRQVDLDRAAAPELYYPIAQNYSQLVEFGLTLAVRATDAQGSLVARVRQVIHDVVPNQAIFNVKTMDDVVDESLRVFSLYLWLMGSFAGLALALALVGTYGVIAYTAASRTREFAVRVALGADRRSLTGLVVRGGLRLTALGIAIGVAASLAGARLLQTLPVTVRGPNAAILSLTALALATAAMFATIVPAIRAAGADPMAALRDD